MFIDKIKINAKAGCGGDGAVSFRREKYVAKGGPDGGDGGNGGSIIVRCDDSVNTLLAFRYKRKFAAENGANGSGAKCHGKNGESVIIKVPRGTLIKDPESGRIIKDMCDDEDFVLCRGGRGGWGNRHFATPTRQIPRFAKSGLPGEEKEVTLELKMIADVGLVGLPSAGKSSLLGAISAARPKVAEYHFTTLEPSLGVVSVSDENAFVAADIPGLIEGASDGLGLGHDFLRHIERCRMLIQVIDAAGTEGRTPLEDFRVIDEELTRFSQELASRPRIIAANKADLMVNSEEEFSEIPEISDEAAELEAFCAERGYSVIYISATTRMNLRTLIAETARKLATLPPTVTYDPEIIEEESRDDELAGADAVSIRRGDDASFIVSGEWAEKLAGRVNFADRDSLMYFERSLIRGGIIDRLRAAGCEEGDTVNFCGMEFDFID